jgi:tRNA pseudouridine-54 N-methylase
VCARCASGICEGIGATDSSKAALMRQGMKEIALFAREFDTSDSFQVRGRALSCRCAAMFVSMKARANPALLLLLLMGQLSGEHVLRTDCCYLLYLDILILMLTHIQ